jgi:hypothetical protein
MGPAPVVRYRRSYWLLLFAGVAAVFTCLVPVLFFMACFAVVATGFAVAGFVVVEAVLVVEVWVEVVFALWTLPVFAGVVAGFVCAGLVCARATEPAERATATAAATRFFTVIWSFLGKESER